MPDATLSDLADGATCPTRPPSRRQVRRMLADPKARALTDTSPARGSSSASWPTARPSTEFFPTFNGDAPPGAPRRDGHLLRQPPRGRPQRPGTARRRLCLPESGPGPALRHRGRRRDRDPPGGPPAGSHRGGLLGMGSVLAPDLAHLADQPDAPGEVHPGGRLRHPAAPSPARRRQAPRGGRPRRARGRSRSASRWPGTPGRPSAPGATRRSTRWATAWRTSTPSAVGGSSSAAEPLDSPASCPAGEAFDGADQLKQVLLARKGDFERNLIERMLSYALGRERPGGRRCARPGDPGRRWSGTGIGSRRLVLGVARSLPFQDRRDAEAAKRGPETRHDDQEGRAPVPPRGPPGGGAVLALPYLEAMAPRRALGASAGRPPLRLGIFSVTGGTVLESWRPKEVGPLGKLPSILRPLEPFKDDLLVLSGLAHSGNSEGPERPRALRLPPPDRGRHGQEG